MVRNVVHNIVDTALHRAARRTDMATPAKIAGDLAYIDFFSGTQAHLKLLRCGLVEKNCGLPHRLSPSAAVRSLPDPKVRRRKMTFLFAGLR